jgi:hypothetical protein
MIFIQNIQNCIRTCPVLLQTIAGAMSRLLFSAPKHYRCDISSALVFMETLQVRFRICLDFTKSIIGVISHL